MAAVNKGSLDVLVNEMGFSRVEASMALSECNGNVEQAIEKLVAGAYAPPPYSEINQTVSAASEKTSPTFVSPDLINLDIEPMKQDLANKGIVFDSNPPPYSQVSLQAELNAWEDKSSADFFELGGMYNRSGGVSVGRCSSCFDEIFENEKAGLTNKAVKDGIRVSSHVRVHSLALFLRRAGLQKQDTFLKLAKECCSVPSRSATVLFGADLSFHRIAINSIRRFHRFSLQLFYKC